MSPVSDLTSEALSRLAKCPWHQGTQMDVAWPWSKLRHCPPSPWRTQPQAPAPRPPLPCTHFLVCLKTEQQNRQRISLEVSKNLSQSNIKNMIWKQKWESRLDCVSEISIVWYCLREEEAADQRAVPSEGSVCWGQCFWQTPLPLLWPGGCPGRCTL